MERMDDQGSIEKGKAVIVVKGRKVPIGTKGIVRWIGSNRWGYSVGLSNEATEAGKLLFVNLDNVRLDESPEAMAAEVEGAHESALWHAARMAEASRVAAEVLPTVTVAKGDKVVPKSGAYAGRNCRVIWVGAKAEGVKVGVVPVLKPTFHGGRMSFPHVEADWLPVAEVSK